MTFLESCALGTQTDNSLFLLTDSFPATALTQQFPDSSDSDDDHITIARAVQQQGMKRKANVLRDDSESEG